MKVIRARAMGMCFGVRDALASAARVDRPGTVTIYGELVHNRDVTNDLKQVGFQLQSERDRERLPESGTVLITAHGLSDRRRRWLTDAGKALIDTTCPLVVNVHEAARRFAEEGRFIVIIGRRNHVEVNGVAEDLDSFAVVAAEADVSDWKIPAIGIVCQSTTPIWKAMRMERLIRAANPLSDIRFANTVCRPTRERQEAMEELAAQVRVVVIVGGANSNNTRELGALADILGMTAHHVTSAAELRSEWFTGLASVGLTAGTSTPDHVIDDVELAMTSMGTRALGEAA